MAFIYKNPISDSQLNTVETVSRDKTFGTNFSVLQVGGYMEVYTLDDLKFTVEGTGPIELSGNTIPVRYTKRTLPFLNDTLTLNSDNISSGRRRLGMLVFVHETQKTYQYTIPNFETLWDGASGSTTEDQYGTSITTSTSGGEDFIDAWLDNSIEGVSGVTRENARWKIFYGTDWQITGGTYNSGTGTLSLDNNTGGTINVTGFTTGGGSDTYVTGGTYSSGSTTLTLTRNDGNTVDVTGFTSGGGGSLTLQDVTDNGSTTTNGITVASLTSTGDITINEDITAGNGGGGLTGNTVFGNDGLVVNTTGDENSAFGFNSLSGNTTGTQNSAFGYGSLGTNINGDDNTSLGHWSLFSNNNGSDNVAVGSSALFAISSGNRNTSIGKSTLGALNSGNNNIGIGYQAGAFTSAIQSNADATNSIYIGTNTKSDVSGGQNEIVIGHAAIGNGSNTITLGNTGHTDTYLFGTIHGVPFISGGTYSNGTLTLNDADGGTFDVTGFTTGGGTDYYVTGGTYTETTGTLSLSRNDDNNVDITGWSYVKTVTESSNVFTVTLNDNSTTSLTVDAVTGLGRNEWALSGTSTGVSAPSVELPFITGGTYSSGNLTLNINDGLETDITITGLDSDDTYLTGATYTPTTLTLGMNDGTEFSVGGFAPEITGGTLSNGTLSLLDNTNGSVDITGFTTTGNLYSADGQLESNRVVDQDSNSLTFSGGSVSMGTNTTSPVCALLELASTNQGLLIPRMTQAQRLAISSPIAGLIVYCTNSDSDGQEGLYMYKSLGWVNVL